MAINTRDRRASAGACGLVMLVALPTPDSTIGAADRAHSAGFYAGISVGAVASLDAVPGFTIVLSERKTSITVDRQWSIELPERTTSIVVD